MANECPADSFSDLERRLIVPGRRWLAVLLGPLAMILGRLQVSPNLVSGGQIALGVLFIALVGARPRLALAVFLAALLLDALDGVLARRTGRITRFGALFDQFCDHARETMIVAGLAAAGAISPLLAVLYAFTYVAFNFILYLCNYYRASLPAAAKPYLLMYPAVLVYLWFGPNWLNWGVALALLAMAVVIALGLVRLWHVMDEGNALRPT